MKLVVKSKSLVDQTFENVQSVHVQVERFEKDIWYYVIVAGRDSFSCISVECIAVYQKVNKALDLSDQIRAALNTGKEKLEVSI